MDSEGRELQIYILNSVYLPFVASTPSASINSASRLFIQPRALMGLSDCGGAVRAVGSSLRGLLRQTGWEALLGALGASNAACCCSHVVITC